MSFLTAVINWLNPPSTPVHPLDPRVKAAQAEVEELRRELAALEKGVTTVHQIVFGKPTRYPISTAYPHPTPIKKRRVQHQHHNLTPIDFSTPPEWERKPTPTSFYVDPPLFSPLTAQRFKTLSVGSPPLPPSPKTPPPHLEIRTPRICSPIQMPPPQPKPPTRARAKRDILRLTNQCRDRINAREWAKALSCSSGALALKPEDPDLCIKLLQWKAEASNRLNSPQLAIEALSEGLDLPCSDLSKARLHLTTAQIRNEHYQYDRALESVEEGRALCRADKTLTAHFQLEEGLSLAHTLEREASAARLFKTEIREEHLAGGVEAIPLLEEAMQADKTLYQRGITYTAKIHFHLGNWKQAVSAARKALALTADPREKIELLVLMTKALKATDFIEGALIQIYTAIDIDPRNPSLYLLKAELLNKQGNTSLAQGAAEAGLGLKPEEKETRGRLLLQLAISFAALAKFPKAKEWAEKAKTIYPDHQFATQEMNPFLKNLTTCEQMHTALSRPSRNPNALAGQRLKLASTLLELGCTAPAVVEARLGLSLSKSLPMYRVQLGAVYADALNLMGKHQKALEAIVDAEALDWSNAYTQAQLSRAEKFALDMLGPPHPPPATPSPSRKRKRSARIADASGKKSKTTPKGK